MTQFEDTTGQPGSVYEGFTDETLAELVDEMKEAGTIVVSAEVQSLVEKNDEQAMRVSAALNDLTEVEARVMLRSLVEMLAHALIDLGLFDEQIAKQKLKEQNAGL